MLSRARNEKGFTLLEVLVAFVILAFGFVAVIELNSGSIRSAVLSERYLTAVTLAENKYIELEPSSFDTESSSGVFESQPDYRWELEPSLYSTPLTDKEFNVGVMQVNLKIYWNDSKDERTFELVSLKTIGNMIPATDEVIKGTNRGKTATVSQTKTIEGNFANGGKPSLPITQEAG